jgi:hypothetical protein
VQGLVERHADALAAAGLDRPGHRVAQEQHAVHTGQLRGLRRLERPLGGLRFVDQHDLRSGGDVEARLDDAVVAERDADARVRSEQAARADRDAVRAAAGERAHDRRSAADVGSVADDDALRDASLDHRGADGAGVEVDEALVHHDGSRREVRTESHA